MRILRTLTAAVLAASCLAPAVRAYDISTFLGNTVGWSSNSATIRFSAVSFPNGTPFATSLEGAMAKWNNNPSPFNFFVSFGDTSVSSGNFQNEAWFAAPGADTPPAECWSWALGAGIVEADLIFYTDTSWTTSTSKTAVWTYGGSNRPFQATALHELGHALGLNHEADEYNIMGEDWTHIHLNGNTIRPYFGEDGADGAVAIYGTSGSAGQDVSVVHMERIGNDGEYSLHGFTRMRDGDGTSLPFNTLSTGERRYRVSPGQQVQVTFSYENNGRSNQSVDVGFYISTNNTISTADTRFATRNPTVNRNSVYTNTYTLTLPSTLTVGDEVWLGAIVDYTGSISEFDESNNTAQFPLLIVN